MSNGEFELLSYDEVLERIGDGTRHLLLGNGFSIGCDPIFEYGSLYEKAVEGGLSDRAKEVFARLGTNNFEGVMRLLTDVDWVARTYDLVEDTPGSAMLDDVEVVKDALITALAESHLDHTGHVPDEKKASAAEFISNYKNIFCTNYDLVLYWVVMHEGAPEFRDGFYSDPDDPDLPYLVFDGYVTGRNKGMFFLHGALQLYVEGSEIRKHSWGRTATPITELVREGLDREQYPLFVAEGDPEKKAAQIRSNGYLFSCLDKLSRIGAPVVTYGHALGDSDAHIRREIARNFGIDQLFVGLFGDPESPDNCQTRANAQAISARREARATSAGRTAPLNVHFFDSQSARVWERDVA